MDGDPIPRDGDSVHVDRDPIPTVETPSIRPETRSNGIAPPSRGIEPRSGRLEAPSSHPEATSGGIGSRVLTQCGCSEGGRVRGAGKRSSRRPWYGLGMFGQYLQVSQWETLYPPATFSSATSSRLRTVSFASTSLFFVVFFSLSQSDAGEHPRR